MTHDDFMREAISLASESARAGGGPFGAVVVCDGKVIARGSNSVTTLNDPTAHAEVTAIRSACAARQNFKLDGCDLYTSCEPCPMCLGAAYWAGIRTIYYGANQNDASSAGFDDSFIYDQITLDPASRTIPFVNILRGEAVEPFRIWQNNLEKIEY